MIAKTTGECTISCFITAFLVTCLVIVAIPACSAMAAKSGTAPDDSGTTSRGSYVLLYMETPGITAQFFLLIAMVKFRQPVKKDSEVFLMNDILKHGMVCLCLLSFAVLFTSTFVVANHALTQTQCIKSNILGYEDPGMPCLEHCELGCEPGHWYTGLCRLSCEIGCGPFPSQFPI